MSAFMTDKKVEPEKVADFSPDIKWKIRKSNAILTRWAETCRNFANSPALISPDGTVLRTFSDVDTAARELADQIGRRSSPGNVVAIQGINSAAWIESLLATWMAGCCVLLEDDRLADQTRDAAERNTGSVLRVLPTAHSDSTPCFHMTGHAPQDAMPDADLIKLTSGTSGEPRAMLFSADQLLADCESICSSMGICRDDRNFGVIAFSHSYGFSNLVTPLLCQGVPLVVAGDALPRAVLSGVARSGATVLPAVPAIFESMAALNGEMPLLRLCISAGAPLRTSVADAFRAQFGHKLHSFYGASECGGICYDRTPERVEQDGFVGTPLDGITLATANRDSKKITVSVTGEAVGIGSFSGGGVEFSHGTFTPADWLCGNSDSGLWIVGRDSDTINSAGRKVNPAEIEAVLRRSPGVRDAVVFGIDDARRGQRVCAIVAATEAVTIASINAHCESGLRRWQIPHEIRMVAAIPVNARGKITRREIAAGWCANPTG